MISNQAVPAIEIDPVEATVTLAGRELAADPVRSVPLNRAYLIT
jgi:urease alpha subunit